MTSSKPAVGCSGLVEDQVQAGSASAQEKWKGVIYWHQSGEKIFPLVTEPTEETHQFYVNGTISTLKPFEHTWCKHLKLVFWHSICVVRLLHLYKQTHNSGNNHDVVVGLINIEESEDKEFFVKPFQENFMALVMDPISKFFVMAILHNRAKEISALIPVDKKTFTSMVFSHLYIYFVMCYDILQYRELTHDILAKAEKVYFQERGVKSLDERKKELMGVWTSTDNVKRNLFCSILYVSKEFEKKLATLTDPQDIH